MPKPKATKKKSTKKKSTKKKKKSTKKKSTKKKSKPLEGEVAKTISSTKVKNDNGLSDREQRFVDEYIVDLRPLRAALAVGFRGNSASVRACQMLNKESVRAVIKERLKEAALKADVSAERVLKELALIAFSSLEHFEIDPVTGDVVVGSEMDPEVLRAVSSIKKKITFLKTGERVVSTNLRLWDKLAALKMLAQYLKLFGEVNINLNLTHEEMLRELE